MENTNQFLRSLRLNFAATQVFQKKEPRITHPKMKCPISDIIVAARILCCTKYTIKLFLLCFSTRRLRQHDSGLFFCVCVVQAVQTIGSKDVVSPSS